MFGSDALAHEDVGPPRLERFERLGDRFDSADRGAALLKHGPQQIAAFAIAFHHQHPEAVERRRGSA